MTDEEFENSPVLKKMRLTFALMEAEGGKGKYAARWNSILRDIHEANPDADGEGIRAILVAMIDKLLKLDS